MPYEAKVFSLEDDYVTGELTVSEKGIRLLYRLKGSRSAGLFGSYESHPLQETTLTIAEATTRLQKMNEAAGQFAEAIAAAKALGAK